MTATAPHFLLLSRTSCDEASNSQCTGRWQFVLEAADGSSKLEAADEETQLSPDRLALLAVVRGLEALDQPSRVTLVTASRYVSRGMNHGLAQWRANDWQWEHSGQATSVRNNDLWRRVDTALRYHQVRCRCWRFDEPHLAGHRWREHESRGFTAQLVNRAKRWLKRRPKRRASSPAAAAMKAGSRQGFGQQRQSPRRPHFDLGRSSGITS